MFLLSWKSRYSLTNTFNDTRLYSLLIINKVKFRLKANALRGTVCDMSHIINFSWLTLS
ncbi:hypothetical protein THF1D04_140045 [Vibrio owensii]|uniref:Uncharacterized protein n=1 Tax=Vibrio owensii TaxID=696485 RepID=A0AAU9Q197_9VIBR|nr:hypothetical protein THF1D04_140045 [Vibrio owensii]